MISFPHLRLNVLGGRMPTLRQAQGIAYNLSKFLLRMISTAAPKKQTPKINAKAYLGDHQLYKARFLHLKLHREKQAGS